MGKIADAFERRDRENLLKIDTRLREQPIRLPQGKPKGVASAEPPSVGEINGKLIVLSDPESADAEIFALMSRIFLAETGKAQDYHGDERVPWRRENLCCVNLAASMAVARMNRCYSSIVT
jgi:hypothetical protein